MRMLLKKVSAIHIILLLLVFGAGDAYTSEEEIITHRYPSGNKSSTITIIDQEAIVLKSYHDNGILRAQQRVINGYQDGEYISWFANGQVSVKGQYEMGKPLGEFIYYREDGTISAERVFTKNGKITAKRAQQVAEDAKSPKPIPSYNAIFQFIAKEYNLPLEMDSLLKLAAESTLRRHLPIGKYEEVISIEAQYLGERYSQIRGAHNGGNFYIFGRIGNNYEHIGTLEGDSLKAGTVNSQLVFYTYSHWGAAEGIETRYMWKGRRFMRVEQKLYQYSENGQKILLKDFMNE